jgi:hypothetical protein
MVRPSADFTLCGKRWLTERDDRRDALAHLSRDDTLFFARINAIVSGFGPGRANQERQTQSIEMVCSEDEKRALPRYTLLYGGPERAAVFFPDWAVGAGAVNRPPLREPAGRW